LLKKIPENGMPRNKYAPYAQEKKQSPEKKNVCVITKKGMAMILT